MSSVSFAAFLASQARNRAGVSKNVGAVTVWVRFWRDFHTSPPAMCFGYRPAVKQHLTFSGALRKLGQRSRINQPPGAKHEAMSTTASSVFYRHLHKVPPTAVSGQGVYLTDSEGKRYI